jgi:hypothetical protein
MKIEYFPADREKGTGPKYIFRPEAPKEQRMLTILRNVMLGKPHRLRIVGTENSEKNVPGMPAQPVLAAAFTIEDLDSKVPEEFFPKEVDVLDPSRMVTTPEQAHPVAAAGARNIKVIKQQATGGVSTVIEEK